MSGKLLKICAAVVLIAGTGEVVCQGAEDVMEFDSASSQLPKKRKIEVEGWRDSVSASVRGEIQAVVKVRSGEREKELKLFEIDGTEASEGDRTFCFEVLIMGSSGTITVEGGGGMEYEGNGVWKMFSEASELMMQNGKSFVKFQLGMFDASGGRVVLDSQSNSARIHRGPLRESWKLVLEPLPISEDSVGKKYVGSLNVVVSANG